MGWEAETMPVEIWCAEVCVWGDRQKCVLQQSVVRVNDFRGTAVAITSPSCHK